MRGVFDDTEREPAQPRRDTEFTLGSGMLLGLFFGLVLLCALCFGLGYSMGRRGSPEPAVGLQPMASAQTTLQADITRPKPSATALAGVAQAQSTAVDAQGPDQSLGQAASAPDGNPGGASASAEPTAQAGSSVDRNQVRPAIPPAVNSPLPAQPTAAPSLQPALTSAAPQMAQLMVQIASVSHPEDADVLVNALRRRGYAVVAHRDAADGLIHVRIGPFTSREEADKWRQKLLSDGYNAIVQP